MTPTRMTGLLLLLLLAGLVGCDWGKGQVPTDPSETSAVSGAATQLIGSWTLDPAKMKARVEAQPEAERDAEQLERIAAMQPGERKLVLAADGAMTISGPDEDARSGRFEVDKADGEALSLTFTGSAEGGGEPTLKLTISFLDEATILVSTDSAPALIYSRVEPTE